MTSVQVYAQEYAKIQDQFGMDIFRKGWYTETGTLHGDMVTSVLVKEPLFHQKSKYQDVCIFDSTVFGRVLVLDDVIQLTESDEWVYHEMASFLTLNSHPNPKNVLIIGNGDGGLVREVTKHPLVESITLCEIDEVVIEASKKYLPFTAKGFESPKLTLHVGDGAEHMKKHRGEFDIIINDAPDPKGPAISLYERSYYESMKEALKPGGLLVTQGEVFWFDMKIIQEVMTMARTLFPVVDYSISHIGSYPGGNLGYILCSTSPSTNFRDPIHKFSPKVLKEMGLKYYTPDIHRASMALPLFVAEELGLKWELS